MSEILFGSGIFYKSYVKRGTLFAFFHLWMTASEWTELGPSSGRLDNINKDEMCPKWIGPPPSRLVSFQCMHIWACFNSPKIICLECCINPMWKEELYLPFSISEWQHQSGRSSGWSGQHQQRWNVSQMNRPSSLPFSLYSMHAHMSVFQFTRNDILQILSEKRNFICLLPSLNDRIRVDGARANWTTSTKVKCVPNESALLLLV